jgi:hypothetical protein
VCRGCVCVSAQQQSSRLIRPAVCFWQLMWHSMLACELRRVLPACPLPQVAHAASAAGCHPHHGCRLHALATRRVCRGCLGVSAQQKSSRLRPAVQYMHVIWQGMLACELQGALPAYPLPLAAYAAPAPRLPPVHAHKRARYCPDARLIRVAHTAITCTGR